MKLQYYSRATKTSIYNLFGCLNHLYILFNVRGVAIQAAENALVAVLYLTPFLTKENLKMLLQKVAVEKCVAALILV